MGTYTPFGLKLWKTIRIIFVFFFLKISKTYWITWYLKSPHNFHLKGFKLKTRKRLTMRMLPAEFPLVGVSVSSRTALPSTSLHAWSLLHGLSRNCPSPSSGLRTAPIHSVPDHLYRLVPICSHWISMFKVPEIMCQLFLEISQIIKCTHLHSNFS